MKLNQFKREIFLKKYELLKPNSIHSFSLLMQNEALSHDELQELSFGKFKALVGRAMERCEFYRKFYSEVDFELGDLKAFEDVEQLPVLTRAHLVECQEQILEDGCDRSKLNYVTTGGSSGVPVGVFHPRKINRAAALWRMKSWWGVEAWDDYGTVYREVSDKKKHLKDSVVRWPSARIHLDAAQIDDGSLDSFIAKWNKSKPNLLHGYVGGIVELADYVKKTGVHFHSPKVIWSTSSPLTGVQKHTFESVLGGKVFDQYGCCEVFYLAAEGPEKNGLRVFSDLVHIEVVDEQHRGVDYGVEGEILVTDLENESFPLIRYSNGDRTAFQERPADCSHPYPLIRGVKGRQSERVVLPSGRILTGEYLTTIFDDYVEFVYQFRVHQKECGNLLLSVVPKNEKAQLVLEEVRLGLSEKCGGEIEVELKLVESIPQDRGKLRFISSDYRG